LRFEARFDPLVFHEEARELEASVHQALAPAIRGLKLKVSAVRSRSLTPPPDKHD
jgi:hypothetical protein